MNAKQSYWPTTTIDNRAIQGRSFLLEIRPPVKQTVPCSTSIEETALVAISANPYRPDASKMQAHDRPPILTSFQAPRMAAWFRIWLASLGIVAIGLLVTARCLQPNPAGIGTHQQIPWLPPCGFELMYGFPCPSCGMTTAWAHFMRGQWIAAVNVNAGGFLLALVAGPLGIWSLASAVRGSWQLFKPQPVFFISYSAAIIIVTFSQWLLR